jgi:hypothetical protein
VDFDFQVKRRQEKVVKKIPFFTFAINSIFVQVISIKNSEKIEETF